MNKVVLVGCGNVGMAYAYSLLNQSIGVDELVLVDINKDEDFFYLQGLEAKRMYENAKSLYNINPSRLKRYARRRGLKLIEQYD